MKLNEIIFASHNRGKIIEMANILQPLEIRLITADEISMPEVDETGTTFEENATLKARTIAKLIGKPCIADDSGLCVKALGGRPGVYSARYAPNRNFDLAMDKLLAEIKDSGQSDRSAYFACIVALAQPDGVCYSFEGRVDGKIAEFKSGTGGFGFDPLFIPEGYEQTFAQLGANIKNTISHRARAMAKFVDFLKEAK